VAISKRRQQIFEPSQLVVLVIGQARCADLVAIEQALYMARVLGRDQANLAQHPQRPQGDILEVADWRTDEVERSHRELRALSAS
jgi:hypothetical protein